MGMRPARASSPPVGEVRNAHRIQRAALHCIAAKSDTWALVGAPAKNQSLKPFFFFFFFDFINLLHGARSQSVVDYLQQVAYSFRGLRGQKPPS